MGYVFCLLQLRISTSCCMFAEVVPQGVDYINYVVAGLLEVADDVHVVDRMELEIAHYLNKTAEGRLSNEAKLRIAAITLIM